MKRFLMAAAVLVFTAATSTAGPIRDRIAARFGHPAPVVQYHQPQQGYAPAGGVQWKADVQAQSGRMFHPGGGMVPGANYEGVGYSSASPADALAHCCNNGGPVVAQAVSQGPGGWYAVKQYGTPGVGVYQPGPVQVFAGQVIQATGQVVQNVGQAVQMPFTLQRN